MALRNYMYSKHKQHDDISHLIFQGKEEATSESTASTKLEVKNIVEHSLSHDEVRSDTLVHRETDDSQRLASIEKHDSGKQLNARDGAADVSADGTHKLNIEYNKADQECRSDSVVTLGSLESSGKISKPE